MSARPFKASQQSSPPALPRKSNNQTINLTCRCAVRSLRLRFDVRLLQRVPYEGVSRMQTSLRRHHRDRVVRRGVSSAPCHPVLPRTLLTQRARGGANDGELRARRYRYDDRVGFLRNRCGPTAVRRRPPPAPTPQPRPRPRRPNRALADSCSLFVCAASATSSL